MSKLTGSVTVLIGGHRLSTVRKCDQIMYVNKGEIVFQGSSSQVRSTGRDFNRQAEAMGL